MESGECCQRMEQEMKAVKDKHISDINELNSQIYKLQFALLEAEKREIEIKVILEEKSASALMRNQELLNLKQNLDTVEEKIRKEREEHENYISQLRGDISKLESNISQLRGDISKLESKEDGTKCEDKVKIACLETEKNAVSVMLEEANEQRYQLEKLLEERNITISILHDHINIEKAKYTDYVAEMKKIMDSFQSHNEIMRYNAENTIKLQEAEEKIIKLEEEQRLARSNTKTGDGECGEALE